MQIILYINEGQGLRYTFVLRGFARTRANLALEIPQQSELTTVNILEGRKHGETSIPGRKF